MATKVEIANIGLISLGADTISAMDEDSINARRINGIYTPKLKALLRKHPWSFAKNETALSRTTDTPTLDDYDYVYTLPSDFIMLTKTSVEPDYSHKIKGNKLYSNSDEVSIEYIYLCEDTEKYDSAFVDALAALLAAELCISITGDKNLAQLKWAEFKEKLNAAKSANALEITPDEAQQDTWLNSRV